MLFLTATSFDGHILVTHLNLQIAMHSYTSFLALVLLVRAVLPSFIFIAKQCSA
jgi:hypothetical protein